MNLRREALAAARRVGIAFGVVILMAAVFWALFMFFGNLTPG